MQPLTGIFACLHTPNSFLSLPTLLSLKQTKYVTSHAKTFLTVSVRTVERTASERIRNGSKNHSKRLHWTAERLKTTCERMRSNGWTAAENFWTDERLRKILERMRTNGWTAAKNFWTDEVDRMNGCWKVLNGWGRTADEKVWTAEIEWLRKSSER